MVLFDRLTGVLLVTALKICTRLFLDVVYEVNVWNLLYENFRRRLRKNPFLSVVHQTRATNFPWEQPDPTIRRGGNALMDTCSHVSIIRDKQEYIHNLFLWEGISALQSCWATQHEWFRVPLL